jgi:hypothetical protein
MSLNLTIRQMPLAVTPTHSDHTWNVVMNDFSAYTDIRLVVDIYANPYLNDSGSTQTSGRVARLLVPPNQYGNCIFNIETIIYNLVDVNPRNLDMNPGATSGTATMNPYSVMVSTSANTEVQLNTSQATINNDRISTVSFSNGFNGGYEGFENIYQINEYRCLFGVQYTTTGTSATCASATSQTVIIIPTNYSSYTGYSGGALSLTDASNQPYGVMIYPGVQDNKQMSDLYYYTGTNLNGQYNYLNTKVYSYQMSQSQPGQFMATFGPETIPMTILGSQVYQTRFRTHYYKCPIMVPFMYGANPLFDNSSSVKGINYLQKSQGNGQYNYDTIQTQTIDFTSRGAYPYSYLQQRIAYGIFKPNPTIRTDSDVAIFLTNSCGSIDYNANGVSEIVQYKMVGEECFNNPVSFLFLNRQGVWDTYTFTKKFTKTYNMNTKVYSKQKTLNVPWWNRQSYDSGQSVFYGDAQEIVTVDSGFVQQNDVQVIEELLMSPSVYMMMDNWQPQGQAVIRPYLIPCLVQNKDVKEYIQKYVRIFQYTIELKQVPYRDYFIPF